MKNPQRTCGLRWWRILIGEQHGGLGMSMLDAAIVAEALGAHTAVAPFLGSAVMAPVALQAANIDPGDLLAALANGQRQDVAPELGKGSIAPQVRPLT